MKDPGDLFLYSFFGMFALLELRVLQNDTQRSRAHGLITQHPDASVARNFADL